MVASRQVEKLTSIRTSNILKLAHKIHISSEMLRLRYVYPFKHENYTELYLKILSCCRVRILYLGYIIIFIFQTCVRPCGLLTFSSHLSAGRPVEFLPRRRVLQNWFGDPSSIHSVDMFSPLLSLPVYSSTGSVLKKTIN